MGTPELAVESLRALLDNGGFQVVAVVTQPDQPQGRGLKLQPPAVKALAIEAGLPVLQPVKAREPAFLEQLLQFRPDLIVVTAFGQILPQSILELPPFGCLNVHTSLLPKYRGAAPIQRALLNGETETGVTIMKMDVGLDTGDMLTQETTAIAPEDTSQTLHDRLARLGARLLVKTIPDYVAGRIRPAPQPREGVSYAPKIRKEEGRIDWSRPAVSIWNQARALVPWPGAFTHLPGADPAPLLKIWDCRCVDRSGEPGEVLASKNEWIVACGSGALSLCVVQREGGRRMTAPEFLAGHPIAPGQTLGES
jgi:methionyl-tRNA formyltransferase